jgi:hypothetical protein
LSISRISKPISRAASSVKRDAMKNGADGPVLFFC